MAALEFSVEHAGLRVIAANNNASVTDHINDYGTVYYCTKGQICTLTGFYYVASDDVVYFQEIYGNYVIAQNSVNNWNVLSKANSKTTVQAQSLVNTLISNNKRIFENNLFCARFAYHLTAQEQKDVITLQSRLQERNAALNNSDAFSKIFTDRPAGYVELLPYLEQLKNSVGFVITSTMIAVAVISAALGGLAYWAYLVWFRQSKTDVTYSDKLTKKLLSKLTPQEYEQLLKETKGIVTKANIQAKYAGFGTGAKLMLFGAVAFMAFPKIKELIQQEVRK